MTYIAIEWMSGPEDGRVVRLPLPGDATTFTLGRADDCDVIISHDDRVSRYHARVTVRGEACFLVDTASRNGTWWDTGEQVTGEALLPVGTLFCVGRTRLRIRESAGD